MAKADPIKKITGFLQRLSHTGSSGFEGLVSCLLGEATKQRFRLCGSGRQRGSDAASEPSPGNTIKVEAKHYGKKLGSETYRILAGEIQQAINADPALDLWILAASCPVSEQNALELEAAAGRHGVETLFLDVGPEGLPRLHVLMAANPQAASTWIAQNARRADLAGLQQALVAIASDPRFPVVHEQIVEKKLRSTLLGYEDARRRARDGILRVITDRRNALSKLNQHAAVRDPGAQTVLRSKVNKELSDWWQTVSERRGVLTGEEGAGKTWAVLDWIANSLQDEAFPLFLPLFAGVQSIGPADSIESIVPSLLADWTRVGTKESWKKRLDRWLMTAAASPLFLILADGLNEKASVDWPTFFRTLDDAQWRTSVALIATDRSGHWQPNCATALADYRVFRIGGYTDGELDQALTGKGISLGEIPAELQDLIRKPRYCAVVAEHFREIEQAADFTKERVIYLERKHRAAKKRGEMSEAEFNAVLRKAAVRYRTSTSFDLEEIKDLLPVPDREPRQIYQEIIDGGVLVPKKDRPGKYIVDKTLLVYAFGMLLSDELWDLVEKGTAAADLADYIEAWFEPELDMPLKVEVGGSAVFHSLLESTYPNTARRELLRFWLGVHNWNESVKPGFIDYVLRCPEDFLEITEDFWSSARDRGAAKQFLAEAYVKHRDHPTLQPRLISRVEHWMGFLHRLGHPLGRGGPERTERVRSDIESRAGRPLAPGENYLVAGESLSVIDDDSLLRLKRFVFLLLSVGPIIPFKRALVRWALASAVMGWPAEYEIANWVFRLSEEDLEAAFLPECTTLFDSKDPIQEKAAQHLLHSIDTNGAQALLAKYPLPEGQASKDLRQRHTKDPCTSGMQWDDEDCKACMDREDISVIAIIERFEARSWNPQFVISPSVLRRAEEMLAFDPQSFRASLSHTREILWYERVLPVLASRKPTVVANFVRSAVNTLPARNERERYALAIWLPEISLICTDPELSATRQVLKVLHEKAPNTQLDPGAMNDDRVAEADLFLALFPHLPPYEALLSLVARPKSALDLVQFEYWFPSLSSIDAEKAVELIASTEDELALTRIFWFLGSTKLNLLPQQRAWLVALTKAPDRILRGAVLRFLYFCDDDELGREVLQAAGPPKRTLEWDSVWLIHVWVRYSAGLSFESLLRSLHIADVGFALEQRGFPADEVRLYASAIDNLWRQITGASDPQLPDLPRVLPSTDIPKIGTAMPEFQNENSRGITFQSPSATWRSLQSTPPTEHFFPDAEKEVQEMNQRAIANVEAIAAAWGTDAFQWYGRQFNPKALERVLLSEPERIKTWIAPLFRQGSVADNAFQRLGAFAGALCPILLVHEPSRGLELWKLLRSRIPGLTLTDAVECAFSAPENQSVSEARWSCLMDAYTDAHIASAVNAAETHDCRDWLKDAIRTLATAGALAKRARALTAASFSDISFDDFDSLVSLAQVENTWVQSLVPRLRTNVGMNAYAKYWFEVFLTDQQADTAWGALEMCLSSADLRFKIWQARLGKMPETADLAARRRKFLVARRRDLQERLDREKDRKEILFGVKIARGEIFPFMGN